MGIFDLFEDLVDTAIKLPGRVLETAAETVVRLPEIPIKAAEGLVKGVEKGVEKLGDSIG